MADNEFMQYGVKGMHWGQRRAGSAPSGGGSEKVSTEVVVNARPGKLIKTTGGKNLPAHPDAVRIAVTRQTAKKSTTDALSTKDLQDLVNRMNLEEQYSKLSPKNLHNQTHVTRVIKQAIGAGKTLNQVHTFLNSPAGKALRVVIKAKTGK